MTKIYTLQEIDTLISKCKKNKDPKIMETLLKAFEGFIVKYAWFLKYGKCIKNDRDLVGLIKLLQKGGMNTSEMVKRIFESWTYDDIINELKYIFLKSVNQFTKRKEGPYFTGYLYTCYKYMIKQWIRDISKDVMSLGKIENVDELSKKDRVYISDNEPEKIEYENFCMTEKTCLTQYEKYILYLHYGKKISVSKIAKMYGMDRTSINLIKKQAKDKLINSGMGLDDFEKI